MSTVDYDHAANLHSLTGPAAAIPVLFEGFAIRSLLDVGCGTGTWLNVAMDYGIQDVCGIDGIDIPGDRLKIPARCFSRQDLTTPWNLGRKFDAALCLEVAEHIEEPSSAALIEGLARHSDLIFFSAACPGQSGQHHVNCQWPEYWQRLFNQHGYACSDELRWKIWNDDRIEPWYRQNLFVARRNPKAAGAERRITAVMHPIIVARTVMYQNEEYLKRIEHGQLGVRWYLQTPFRALTEKMRRHLHR